MLGTDFFGTGQSVGLLVVFMALTVSDVGANVDAADGDVFEGDRSPGGGFFDGELGWSENRNSNEKSEGER